MEPVKKKDYIDVIVKYVNRLFSCNQHFQLLLYIALRNAWKYFKVIWKSRGILFCLFTLLPNPRDPSITTRLRSTNKFPRLPSRTRRYQTFISYSLSQYQSA